MGDRKIKQVALEFYPRDIRNVGYHDLFKGIERIFVISPISLMPERSALLIIVKWMGEEDLSRWEDYHLIEKVVDMGEVKDGRMYLLMGKEEPWYFGMIQMIQEEMRVFFNWPIILEPDRIQIKWIGYLDDISRVMDIFKDMEMKETITSIVDYNPSVEGALEKLTDRQYDLLMEAYSKGLFNDRRGITINELAKDRGISPPSYMLTLRRALKNLIRGSMI